MTDENTAAAACLSYGLAIDIESTGRAMIDADGTLNTRLLQIGACFGSADGSVIETGSWCWPVPASEKFDARTYEEFWSKHPAILERIDRESKSEPTPFTSFLAWLKRIEQRYGPFGKGVKEAQRLRWVSDNPAFDISEINVNIVLFTQALKAFRAYTKTAKPTETYINSNSLARDLDNLATLLEGQVPTELKTSDTARAVIEAHGGKPLSEMFTGYVPCDDPTEVERGLTPAQRARVESFITAPHDHWAVNDATQHFQRWCGVQAVLDDSAQAAN